MATYDELPVFKATYDLLLEFFRFTKDFCKEYKYTVGESLKKETLTLIIGNLTCKREKLRLIPSQPSTFGKPTRQTHKPNLPKELVCSSALIDKIMKEEFWRLQIPNRVGG